jgi:hypothetical protein
MRPLIDADILRYEVGACGQYTDDEGKLVIRDFDFVGELLDQRILEICEGVFNTEPPILFLTSDPTTHRILHRGEDLEFTPNFREAIATTKPYKGTRKTEKPYHYDNLTSYILGNYNCREAIPL